MDKLDFGSVVITGATGFIGSVLATELYRSGYRNLVLVDYVEPSKREKNLQGIPHYKFFEADDFLDQFKSNMGPVSAVFHMGACSSTTETRWDYLEKVNVSYTQQIFKECTRREIPLIYASSGAVYGNGSLGFDDSKPSSHYVPLNLYGKSKQAVDVWAEEQAATPPFWYGLRFFNVFGPNEYHKGEMSSVAYKAFHQIHNTQKLKLFKSHNPKYPDGGQLRDFIYVKDICRWMIELWEKALPPSGIYNQGLGRAHTWLDLATAVFSAINTDVQIDWIDIPENIRDQYQYFTEADMRNCFSHGLTQPCWPLFDAIQDYVKNYLEKSNPYL